MKAIRIGRVSTSTWGIVLLVAGLAVATIASYYLMQTPPDLIISVSSNGTIQQSSTIQQGGSGTATVSVTSVGGYSETVSLSVSGQPPGVTINFSQSSGVPTLKSTMVINVGAEVPAGTYDLIISVTGAEGKKWTYPYSLVVTPAPDFTISVSPTSGSIQHGSSGTATVSVTSVGGYSETVSLSVSGQPPGVTVDFDQSSGTQFNSTMTINVDENVSTGTYDITITGIGGDGKMHSCTYSLTVTTGALTLTLYSDAGIPPGMEVYTWHGGSGAFDGDYLGESPPEGTKCFKTYSANWAGWGVFYLDNTTDLSSYSGGYLKFWVKSPITLKVEIEGPRGTKSTEYIDSTGDAWQEISIAISDFTEIDLTKVYSPFLITAESPATFYVDHVRWTAE